MKRNGFWIWQTSENVPHKQSVLFRRSFLYNGGIPVNIDISASSRYKLYINGNYVCNGPQRGDRFRQFYDTLDISQWLRSGHNVIGVHVQHYPMDYYKSLTFESGPISVVNSSRGGFWLSCDMLPISTDSQWECCSDDGYCFVEAVESKYAGDMELRDGRKQNRAWMTPENDSTIWSNAVELCPAETHRLGGVLYEWQLQPRSIPMLFEKETQPAAIAYQTGMDFSSLLQGGEAQVPPHSQVYVDLDMGQLVNTYVALPLRSTMAGAAVTLEYSESYRTMDSEGRISKKIRDEAGELLCGERDEYITVAGSQVYEPFSMRVFRYLRIKINTDETSVSISMPVVRLTGYPLEEEGAFCAKQPALNKMWEISERTLRRCMLDTYIDCPYYEQMQYIMDTMIEALLTFQISMDDRLVRRAIEDFHSSQRPDGMIQCNAPAAFAQIIPVFALYYADLLYYHYQYYGDKQLLKKYLPTMIGIIRYFQERIDSDTGLLGGTGYWSFVDWVEQWRCNHGSPVSDPDEPLYIYSHIFAYALERTSYMLRQIGWDTIAEEYCIVRRNLIQKLREQTKSENGYYRISAGEVTPCQHSQLWAVLSGCAKGDEARNLMHRCMTDPELLQCSYSMSFYLFRAMEVAGIYDAITTKWQPWINMMEQHVTTWVEDAVTQRSDCHGWSAIPMYDMVAVILGVRPEKPGYEEIRIEPHGLDLGDISARVATCRGPISICRTVKEGADGYHVSLKLSLPEIIPVHIYSNGSKCASFSQKEITFDYIS